MIVRPFKKSDAPACCNVINSCLTAMTNLDNPTRFYAMSNNIPADFYAAIKDDYALVAELHGQIVGVAALHDDEMHHVYVSPDYQGSGIGETLVLALEAEAKAYGITQLHITAAQDAVEFFKHIGYRIQGNQYRKVKYSAIQEVKMTKTIAESASV